MGRNLNQDLSDAKPLAFFLFHQKRLTCLCRASRGDLGWAGSASITKGREETQTLPAAL